MPFSHFHQMQGSVQVEIGCPSCGTRMTDGRLLEHQDDAHVSHFECAHCSRCSLAFVYPNDMGVSSVVVMTDLTFEDVVRMRNARAIVPDDVIALHQVLNRPGSGMLFSRVMRRDRCAD